LRVSVSAVDRQVASQEEHVMSRIIAFTRRHQVPTYYALVVAISWGGILLLAVPGGIPGTSSDVARLFPFALIVQFAGPSIAGILMTGLVSGRAGLRELLSRMLRWRVGARWYAAALLAGPLIVAAVLLALATVSPVFVPGIVTTHDRTTLLLFGLGWGLVGGGLLEELGWTGFALPRLRLRHGALATGLIVGVLWGVWHFPIAFWGSRALAGGLSLTVIGANRGRLSPQQLRRREA
jgi:membrane protease YdiL (CAAX protease family)